MRSCGFIGAVALILLIALLTTIAKDAHAEEMLRIPDEATAKTLEGRTVSLADYRGKLVFLVIWKTDCFACLFEIPTLNRLHEEYSSEDFAVIGLSMDRNRIKQLTEVIKKYNIAYPVWLGHGQPISEYTDVPIFPVLLVIGPDGNVVGHFLGAFHSYEHATAAMKEARAIIEKGKEDK